MNGSNLRKSTRLQAKDRAMLQHRATRMYVPSVCCTAGVADAHVHVHVLVLLILAAVSTLALGRLIGGTSHS
jgi:hypothetical protein